MQSNSATYESILPGSNSMRLAGTALPNVSSELSTRAASQLTSAEARKVGLQGSHSSHVCSREFGGVQIGAAVRVLCCSAPAFACVLARQHSSLAEHAP